MNGNKKSKQTAWLSDMDGVLVHEKDAIAGASDFIEKLKEKGIPFLVLTNNSIFTPRDLSARLKTSGIEVSEENIWTSALATAHWLSHQSDNKRAFVLGEAGLTTALYEAGFIMTEVEPEYVILGETRTYSFEEITTAIRLIESGAKFIATNPDPTGPSLQGTLPATGAIAALIEKATNKHPYYVGKPNPIMLRYGLNKLGFHSENTSFVGDRMDTDILSGMEAGLETHLVLTGSTKRKDINNFPYRPNFIHDSIADIVDLL